MKALAVAAICALMAALTAPKQMATEAALDPWPEPIVRVASLGRSYAASDIVWLQIVQLIGSTVRLKAGLPGLEKWIDVATSLDPKFGEPYYFGAILLVTDDKRSNEVDALLQRGEDALPDEFLIPMWRGFSSYAGRLDPKTAAKHFRRAATKPRAPAYLVRLAQRLEKEGDVCRGILQSMQDMSEGATSEQSEALLGERRNVLKHCMRTRIEHAAIAYRVKHQDDRLPPPTLDALIAEGLPPPTAPKGECWFLDEGGRASLKPCPAK